MNPPAADFGDLTGAIERFDLLAYVRGHGAMEYGVQEWCLICPDCGKDKLIVHVQKKTWHCWVCERFDLVATSSGVKRRAASGAGGLVDLIRVLEGVSGVQAAQRIIAAGYLTAGDLFSLPPWLVPMGGGHEGGAMVPHRISLPTSWTADPYAASAEIQRRNYEFMIRRGISGEDWQRYRLGWCSGGHYAGRLIFPVYESGILVYWQARAMWDAPADPGHKKVLNPSRGPGEAGAGDVLMNLDLACTYPRVALVEGPIDLIHVGPHAVASFGKRLSSMQALKMIRAGVTGLDICWDSDAYADAVRVAQQLGATFDVRVVRLPSGDPGDWSPAHNAYYRDQAERLPGLERV